MYFKVDAHVVNHNINNFIFKLTHQPKQLVP